MKAIKNISIKTYIYDGRKEISEIYESFERLEEEFWIPEIVHNQKFVFKRKNRVLPILSFRTKQKGRALWLIGGIHGEEPAGPNTISEHIGFLNDLARKIPIVLLPLCNPAGYVRNWRYPDQKRIKRNIIGKSVGSSEHYLLSHSNPKKSRAKKPVSEEAAELTSYVVRHCRKYPPIIVMDFHEDESSTSSYIYSQGKLGAYDPAAREVVSILTRAGFKLRMYGKTNFNEKIVKGIVSVIADSSIDELLASRKIIAHGKIIRKPAAKSVIVIETNTKNVPLTKRIEVHREILLSAKRFYDIAKEI